MLKNTRQEFAIHSCPVENPKILEKLLNDMSKAGWDLYSIHETGDEEEIKYNCIFIREIERSEEDGDLDDITGFKTAMERMMSSNEQPYDMCVSLQQKIKEKKEKIEDIKNFLDTAKENEREVLNNEISKELETLNSLKKQLKKVMSPSKMAQNLGEERLSLSLSEELYCINNYEINDNILAQTVKIRQELTNELGYIIPKIKFIEEPALNENEFTINVHGIPVVKSFAYPAHLAFFEDDLNIKPYPKGSIKFRDPITSRKMVWIEKNEAKDYWTSGLNACEYIGRLIKYYSVHHVSEIFSYSDINRYIEMVSENNSFLIDSILGEYISVAELKYIFCELIKERISVKDVIYIFEKINDFSDEDMKSDALQRIRIALSRQICNSYANDKKQIFAYEVSEKTLDLLEEETQAEEEYDTSIIRIDGNKFKKFVKSLSMFSAQDKTVLIVPNHLRQVFFALISQMFMDIPVLSYEEISSEYEIKLLGVL